jgi:hypothetical protein
VNGKVSNAIGLGSTAGIGPQQDLDDIGRGLETAGSVQRKVSAIVQTRRLLGKGGLLLQRNHGNETKKVSIPTYWDQIASIIADSSTDKLLLTLLRLKRAPKPLQKSCNFVSDMIEL